eukprot:GEMP01005185.1.p1 GENE.GEMP01005185.1~~GEMP01005185.1.p1  ORF type:complete len:1206 (+),score=310.30 GEMP01005185.1:72-3620(+)
MDDLFSGLSVADVPPPAAPTAAFPPAGSTGATAPAAEPIRKMPSVSLPQSSSAFSFLVQPSPSMDAVPHTAASSCAPTSPQLSAASHPNSTYSRPPGGPDGATVPASVLSASDSSCPMVPTSSTPPVPAPVRTATSAYSMGNIMSAPYTAAPMTHSSLNAVPSVSSSAFGFLAPARSSTANSLPNVGSAVIDAPRKKTRKGNVPGYVTKELVSQELFAVREQESTVREYEASDAPTSPAASVPSQCAPPPPPPERPRTTDLAVSEQHGVHDGGLASAPRTENTLSLATTSLASYSAGPSFGGTSVASCGGSSPNGRRQKFDALPAPPVPPPTSSSSSMPPPPPPPARGSDAGRATRSLTPEEALILCTDMSSIQLWAQAVVEEMNQKNLSLLDSQGLLHAEMQRAEEDMSNIRQKMQDTEAEQNALCDQDKFLEAEALDARISVQKQKVSSMMKAIMEAGNRRRDIMNSLSKLSKERLRLFERCHVRLKEIQAEAMESFEDSDYTGRRHVVSETNRLKSETERISLARKHLDKDTVSAREERDQVEEALQAQTREHREELDQATENAFVLDGEIQALEQELAQKRNQKELAEDAILLSRTKIAAIEAKFDKQFERIANTKRRVDAATAEINADMAALELAQRELQNEVEDRKTQEARRKNELAQLTILQKTMFRQVGRFEKRHRQRERWNKKRLPYEDALAQRRSELEVLQLQAEKLMSQQSARQNDGACSKSKLSTLSVHLPRLEAEKKIAVASRNFKEAGRVAAELKHAEEEKARIERQLEAEKDDLRVLQDNLEESQRAATEKQEEVRTHETACDMKEIKILEKQVLDLQRLSARAKRRGDLESRRIFDCELEICNSRIKHLMQKHHIKSSSVSEVEWSQESSSAESESEETVPEPEAPATVDSSFDDSIPTERDVSAEGSPDEPSGVPDDLAALNAHELLALEAEYRLRVEDTEQEIAERERRIDQCVEAEDFDGADDLEKDRTALNVELDDLRAELDRIVAASVARENAPTATPPPGDSFDAESTPPESVADEEREGRDRQEAQLRPGPVETSSICADEVPSASPAAIEEAVPPAGFSFARTARTTGTSKPRSCVKPTARDDGGEAAVPVAVAPAANDDCVEDVDVLYSQALELHCPLPQGHPTSVVRAALSAWEENRSILHLANAVHDATHVLLQE